MQQYKIKILVGIIALLVLVACKKNETEIPEPEPDPELFVAGYLPWYGMDDYPLETLFNIDRVYYFSVAPDANGEYMMEDRHSENIQEIKSIISGSETELFLVIGGWYESLTIFPMAADENKMEAYTDSIVRFCLENDLDGVDLDWEAYPTSVPRDDYWQLVQVLSDKLRASQLQFTVAVAPSHADLAAQFKQKADQINLMSYGVLDEQGNQVSMDMLQEWLTDFEVAGVPRSKLIVGVPFYAKRKYDPADQSARSITYASIVAQTQPDYNDNKFGKYAYNGRGMMQTKTRFLRKGQYYGIMAWELSQDCDYNSNLSLLKTIVESSKN